MRVFWYIEALLYVQAVKEKERKGEGESNVIMLFLNQKVYGRGEVAVMLFSQNAVVSYFRFIFLSPAVGKDIFFMLVDSEIFDRLEKILNMYFAF